MKRFLSIFLTFILIFNFSFISFSYADTIEDLTNVGFDEVGSGDTSQEFDGEGSTLDEDALKKDVPKSNSIFTKIIDWFLSIFEWLNTPLYAIIFALPTIDGIIFNTNPAFKLSFFDEKASGSVVDSIQGYIGAVYNGFRYLVTAVYIVVLVYLGVRMILSSVGRQKAHYKEMFKHWLIGLLLIFSFHWVMAGIIWISNEFVDILGGVSTELLSLPENVIPSPVKTAAGGFDKASQTPITTYLLSVISTGCKIIPVIGQMLVGTLVLVVFGAMLVIMFTYLKRLFTIALLILLFPFVALSYVFDKMGDRKSQTLNHWTKEFTINVMMQPIHALLLLLISVIYSTGIANKDSLLYGFTIGGAIVAPLTLFLIPVGEKLLKQLFQISSSGIGPASTGLGGQMAKAGLGLRGMKELGSTAGKMGKNIMANHNIKRGLGLSKTSAGYHALKNGLLDKKGVSTSLKDARSAWSTAKKDLKAANKDSSSTYRKSLKEQTGMNSNAGARAKAVATIAGMAMGAGTAITSSETLSQLAGGIATNATMGGTLAGGAVGLPRKITDSVRGEDGNYTSTLEKLRKADLDATDPKTTKLKHKIKADLGIDLSMINNSTKAGLVDDYRALDRYTRFGGKDKDVMASLTSNGRMLQNIDKGLMPDGSGPIDRSKIRVTQDNKNMVFEQLDAHDNVVAKVFAKDRGNSSLKNGEKVTATLAELANAPTPEAIEEVVRNDRNVQRKQNAVLATQTKISELNTTLNNQTAQLNTQEATLHTQEATLSAQQNTLHTQEGQLFDQKTNTRVNSTIMANLQTEYLQVNQAYTNAMATANDATKSNAERIAAQEDALDYYQRLNNIEADINQAQTHTFTQRENRILEQDIATTRSEVTTTRHNISETAKSISKADDQLQKDATSYQHAVQEAEDKATDMYQSLSKSAEDLKNVAASPFAHNYAADVSAPTDVFTPFMPSNYSKIQEFLASVGAATAHVQDLGTGLRISANGSAEDFPNSTVPEDAPTSFYIIKRGNHWYIQV